MAYWEYEEIAYRDGGLTCPSAAQNSRYQRIQQAENIWGSRRNYSEVV